jgi:methyl-accepting chemotaxis protein
MSLRSHLNRLSFKLPLLIVGCVALSTIAVGAGGFVVARQSVLAQQSQQLGALARTQTDALDGLLRQINSDIEELGSNPAVSQAMSNLSSAWMILAPDQDQKLKKVYVTENPNPEDQRYRMDGTGDQTMYGLSHAKSYSYFMKLRESKQLPDLYLISEEGDVVYSNEKRADFATNLLTGPLKDSGLGKAFKQALDGQESNQIGVSDFAPYTPTGAPAAFLARAIKDKNGSFYGVVAIQVPVARLNALFATPFGQTGHMFALGSDGTLRTALPGEARVTTRSYPDVGAQAAQSMIRTGIGGGEVASVFVPTTAFGQTWRVVAEMAVSEIEAPLTAMLKTMALIGAAVFAVLALVAILGARGITRPINRMKSAVNALLAGEHVELEAVKRQDELGELARALRQIHSVGVEAARIRSALDGCPINVMVVDENNVIRYTNQAIRKFLRTYAAEFRTIMPGFDPEATVGLPLDRFHLPLEQDASGAADLQTSRATIGSRILDLAVSPVRSETGERLGALIEWRDRTAALAAQAEVAEVVLAAAAGDFSRRVPLEGKDGFLRDMAMSMNELGASVDQAILEFAEIMKAVAHGDLTRVVETEYRGRFAELHDALNETIERLSETVSTIQDTATDVGSAAREIRAGAEDLSGRTEQQASSLEETAATTEQLAASVKSSAQASRLAVELSQQATDMATSGGDVATQAVAAMSRIEQASRKISEITDIIDEIAFQTNLLALNAAVEAARAGEAGKGFAVVASEVRTLAQRSSEAAKDISTLIAASDAEVTVGVKLVHGAGEALTRIVEASRKVSATVAEISAAAGEQANGIDEMSQAVSHMDEMTQQNAAMAEESAASASSLTDQIERLNELVKTFRTRRGSAASSRQHGADPGGMQLRQASPGRAA